MKKISAVTDTNVFVAALLGSRPAVSVYNAFRDGIFTLNISNELFSEVEGVLSRPKLGIRADDKVELLLVINLGAVITDVSLRVNDCRNPKDNNVLACALGSSSDCIVTCDRDLLILNPYRNIPIISPTKFITLLNKS